MTRRKSQRRPEFESLESMELLSGLGVAGPHEAAQVRVAERRIEMVERRELIHERATIRHLAKAHRPTAGPTPGIALNLSGTVQGTYRVVGGTSAAFTGRGTLSPIGTGRLQGKVSAVGGGGQLALSFGRQGKVFADVTGQSPAGGYTYQIAGGTGHFAGDTGSGVATLESPISGLRGHFALSLQAS